MDNGELKMDNGELIIHSAMPTATAIGGIGILAAL